jgi:hypothetical protein
VRLTEDDFPAVILRGVLNKPSCSFYGFLFTSRLVYEDPEENGDNSQER